jgi:hypothetical protein
MLLTQEPSPASMIQSWGRAGDDEIVILGIILRDFLVDFLRGPAKGVLPRRTEAISYPNNSESTKHRSKIDEEDEYGSKWA